MKRGYCHAILLVCVSLLFVQAAARGPPKLDPNNLKFYIYDFPGDSLGWYSEQPSRLGWLRTSVFYGGYGKPIDEAKGLYQTNQYSLYKILIRRALTDPRRTDNPHEASIFIVPYDMGYDAAIRLEKGIWPHHCSMSTDIEARLNQSHFYRRKNGRDHVLIFSINWGMNYFINPQCVHFLAKVCQYCIKWCIDDYSFLFGGSLEATNPYKNLVEGRGINWRALPFPSDVHWNSKMTKPYPWESDHKRHYLVGYGGSTQSYTRQVARLREKIATQCDGKPDLCIRSAYSSGRSFEYNASAGKNGTIHEIFNSSVFCLNPPGDLPTRKGLFDSLLLGCIPVTFNPLSASAMYTWHWPEALWKQIIVEIDDAQVKKADFNVITHLENIARDEEDIARRQRLLRENAYKLQYSFAEPLQDTRPGPDAFDISLTEAMNFGGGFSDGVRHASIPQCAFKCNT